MWNMKDETHRLKLWLIGALVFAISGWASCREMKYIIRGRTAEAEIINIKIVTVSSGRRYSRRTEEKLAVRYRWTDEDDGVREDAVKRSLDWQQPADGILRIEYLPGVKVSRLQGERNYILLAIFTVIGGTLIFFTVRTWVEAYRK